MNGATSAWSDLLALSRRGARLHMDGARLWEAQPFYGRWGVECREACLLGPEMP